MNNEIEKIRNIGYIIAVFAIIFSSLLDILLWRRFNLVEWAWETSIIIVVATVGIHLALRYARQVLKKSLELESREKDLNEAYLELGKVNRQLASLMEVNRSVLSMESLDDILDFIVRSATMLIKADICTLRILDPEKNELVLKAKFGIKEVKERKKKVKLYETGVERASQEGKSILFLDAKDNLNYSCIRFAKRYNLRSIFYIPLKVKDKLVGTLTLYFRKKKSLSGLNTGFILSFASQAAVALEMSGILDEYLDKK